MGGCIKKREAGTPLQTKWGVEDDGGVGAWVNPLKKEDFITEIQCKRDIYFHLILVGILHFDIVR